MGDLFINKTRVTMKTIKKTGVPTVTVAISAYNEESNIQAFLKSILAQKEDGFILKNIWVYSDGSTDKTTSCAKAIKSNKIKVFDDQKRIGKSSRLNQIYSNLTSDILVQSDADVIFSHPFVIRDIIEPLLNNEGIGMCGGRPMPIKATTLTERAVNFTFEAYDPLRHTLRGGNNIFSVDGRILAYRKELVKKITVPESMIANDAYTYFACLTLGLKYRYIKSAVVYFRSPQNLHDQIRQNTRFVSSPARMAEHFAKELVSKEYFIPKSLLWKNMAKQFSKNPLLCFYIFTVNRYCRLKSLIVKKNLSAKWDMAYSTKKFR